MLGKVNSSDNLSRDKILLNTHKSFQDVISLGKSIDLRNNFQTIDLQNGYEEIIPINVSKIFEIKQ